MMESRYLPVYIVSGVRLNVLVGFLCTVTAGCAKDTKDYLGGVSALFRKSEYSVATYTTKQVLLCGVGL